MSIRNKLILMLAIPLAALSLVAGFGFRSQAAASQTSADAFEDDAVVQSLNRAVQAIGAERLANASGVSGEELDAVWTQTDNALNDIFGAANEANMVDVVDEGLRETRSLVLAARSTSARDALLQMNQASEDLREIRDGIDVDYPEPGSFAEATASSLIVDVADIQDSIWLEYIATARTDANLTDRLETAIAQRDLLSSQIVGIAPDNHTASLNSSLASETERDMTATGIAAVTQANAGNSVPLPDVDVLNTLIASHNEWYEHANSLQSDVAANLAGDTKSADDRQALFGLLATLGLLVLFGLIYVIYRSVVRPLDELLVGAEDVANNRLPSMVRELQHLGSSDDNVELRPLPRESDDELGSLVDAFNDVQLTAFDLAVDQAKSRRNISEMFVNLGRRNQKLLQRMLKVISDLERNEKDPDKLEELFRLDHMTTRMRRNAESLLVLAGTKTPRQWNKPVPTTDVVRSSLAEVEDYQRVDLGDIEDAPMSGSVVADVTHLMAELLENSLQFSEPQTRVEVSARWKDNEYRVAISDRGFGMSDKEFEDNNRRITNPPPLDQAPTRFLGLFVVGHLAKRHDIDVQLIPNPMGGSTAWISIPASIMNGTAEAAPSIEHADDLDDLGLDDLDLDAELTELNESSEFDDLPVRSAAPVAADLDLPVRGESTESAAEGLDELPTRGEAAEQTAAAEELDELPTRGEAAEQTAAAEELDELPTRGEAADFENLPDHDDIGLDSPDLDPMVGTSDDDADLATMGLPTRKPRAALEEAGDLPTREASNAANPEPGHVAKSAKAPASEEEVGAAASKVGSMFSSFQAGVQLGVEETNESSEKEEGK